MAEPKAYKRKTPGRRDKDKANENMINANLWLKIMSIILTLSMAVMTWIATDINNIKSNAAAYYTIVQVSLNKIETLKEDVDDLKIDQKKLEDRVAAHELKDYQTLNERRYRSLK